MMLLCWSFACASFTSRNPPSLSVDCFNSKIFTICGASLTSGHLPEKRFTKKAAGSKLYRVSWLVLTGVITSITCAFSTSSSLLQIFRNSVFSSPQRAHVTWEKLPRVTFFVKRDKLELAFWLLCSMHAVKQVPPDGEVGSRNFRCHPFVACHTACTVDVTVWCAKCLLITKSPDAPCHFGYLTCGSSATPLMLGWFVFSRWLLVLLCILRLRMWYACFQRFSSRSWVNCLFPFNFSRGVVACCYKYSSYRFVSYSVYFWSVLFGWVTVTFLLRRVMYPVCFLLSLAIVYVSCNPSFGLYFMRASVRIPLS